MNGSPIPGTLISTGLLGLVVSMVFGSRRPRFWATFTVAGTLALLGAAMLLLTAGEVWEWRRPLALGAEDLHLRLDGIGALFLALIAVIGGVGSVYSGEYWSDGAYPASAPGGRFWWSGLTLSMVLVVLVANGLHFLIAWELFTVCAYFLITLDRGRGEVRKAGWLYLGASHAGTLALFAFFSTLAARTGGWDLGPMRDRADLAPLFWLALFGFGLKAGMFPLHIWLPSAHANAPSHVSAIMSGVAIKMGIYGLIRFGGWLPVTPEEAVAVMALGVLSATFGMSFALAQTDVKRLLAYCSVENVGVILIGLGAALLGAANGNAAWGRLALAGALLHVWNHGLFKSLLFLGAGSVLHATGTREMSRLGGLWRSMPWTAALFGLGSIAVAALPPLNGFVSEWMIYLGLFESGLSRTNHSWAALPAVIGMAVTGALVLACFIKAFGLVFLGAPRTQSARHAHECGPRMRGSMMILAALCGTIGLAPAILWPWVANATTAWNPAWGPGDPPVPLATLGFVFTGFALILPAGAWLLLRRVRSNGLARAVTWDCGYAAPTSRMQYSAGSFSEIAAGWFRSILRPELRLRRPRGPFPLRADRMERTPETVLEHIIEPAGRLVMMSARGMRQLQHGRLQAYILYLVAGLGLLTLVVLSTPAK